LPLSPLATAKDTPAMERVFGLGDVEKHLAQGDRATLTTKRKQSMKLTLQFKEPTTLLYYLLPGQATGRVSNKHVLTKRNMSTL